jgi:tRNA nucleotidyltransferase/poly(A) polymerase
MKLYEVGGCVRDEFMGRPSSDIDFTVVLEDSEIPAPGIVVGFDPFAYMRNTLEAAGFKIFMETPEFLTIRAQFPDGDGGFNVSKTGGVIRPGRKRLTADFVLARKESDYTDGRRPDSVQPGTLEDDLARRDFTMNAIAKAEDGTSLDPYNGAQAISEGVIEAVGDAWMRLNEDALRAVRALRFSVTLGFRIERSLAFTMETAAITEAIRNKISDERIKDELNKMLTFDTLASLSAMSNFPLLTEAMLSGSVSFEATMKQKGRGRR